MPGITVNVLEIITKYFPDLTAQQITQFAALKDLYMEWNSKINVISRKDMENFYERHVLHSLAIAARFTFTDGYEIMDLGTGGGFPAIPLAIYFPRVKFHLVDSINKKVRVAGEIARGAGLTNTTFQHTRAEALHSRQFDVIVSRAVAPLKELLNWSKPLLKHNGARAGSGNGLICLKGGDLHAEIAACNCKPFLYDIHTLFDQDYFKEKYILFVPA